MSAAAKLLLAHYDAHARDLPWRVGPKSSPSKIINPYHVWLSEIMLQQTTVSAVIPYFEKFIARWPDFHALAAADDADIMAAWAGLGYYARARNLVKCARSVSQEHDGALPQDEDELRSLAGIGDYTAAAIASIAFGRRALVMDANIERVVARMYEIATPLPKGKKEIKQALDKVTPQKRSGDFAQAMMDLGASLCSVKNPKCSQCPLLSLCAAGQSGRAVSFPVKAPKKAKPMRSGMAWWIEYDHHILLVKRDEKSMLGGMMALPDDGWNARGDGDALLKIAINSEQICKNKQHKALVQHSFTHFSLKLKLTSIELNQDEALLEQIREKAVWWPIKDLDQAGLPTLFAKAVKIKTDEKGFL